MQVEAAWPCSAAALRWLAADAAPERALQLYRRAARLQPANVLIVPFEYLFRNIFRLIASRCNEHFQARNVYIMTNREKTKEEDVELSLEFERKAENDKS